MQTETTDVNSIAADFCAIVKSGKDGLHLGAWEDEDWQRLFCFASIHTVKSGEALIRRREPDRSLYFLLSGTMEVTARSSDGMSLGSLRRISPGSVIGEQSFFDGETRSANVWAVEDCEVAAMSPTQYSAFEKKHPELARQLIFALGEMLSGRLRNTTMKLLG